MRLHVTCRVCGLAHHNLRSSSICTTCGASEAAENAAQKHSEGITYTQTKHEAFEDATTVEELKEWIREYML